MPDDVAEPVPSSRQALERVQRETQELGHEFFGPLSESHGFMP